MVDKSPHCMASQPQGSQAEGNQRNTSLSIYIHTYVCGSSVPQPYMDPPQACLLRVEIKSGSNIPAAFGFFRVHVCNDVSLGIAGIPPAKTEVSYILWPPLKDSSLAFFSFWDRSDPASLRMMRNKVYSDPTPVTQSSSLSSLDSG